MKGGAHVHFKVLVQNLGGSTSHIGLDFSQPGDWSTTLLTLSTTSNTVSAATSANPAFGDNYVSCSDGSLGDPSVSPANDDSVTLNIGARVKDRGLTSKDKLVTVTVDPNHSISESRESNNSDTFAYHYD